MSDRIDEFESMFRPTEREQLRLAHVPLNAIVLVTGQDAATIIARRKLNPVFVGFAKLAAPFAILQAILQIVPAAVDVFAAAMLTS